MVKSVERPEAEESQLDANDRQEMSVNCGLGEALSLAFALPGRGGGGEVAHQQRIAPGKYYRCLYVPELQHLLSGGVSAVRVGLSNRANACVSAEARTTERSFLSFLPLLAPCRSMSKASRKACTDHPVATVTCPGTLVPPVASLGAWSPSGLDDLSCFECFSKLLC